MKSETIIFSGPTLHGEVIAGGDPYPPARLGSVYQAYTRGYRRIILIDGFFGNVPSVWHKELLFAMAQGVEVWGAASIGALRAAELARFGMKGFGKVFRLYHTGALTDDDEVCIIHAVRELGYRPLSEAMVNVRCSLRRLRRRGHLDRKDEFALCAQIKALHFSRRTREHITAVFHAYFGPRAGAVYLACYARLATDQKKADALGLLRRLDGCPIDPTPPSSWIFPNTLHWRKEFEENLPNIPALDEEVQLD